MASTDPNVERTGPSTARRGLRVRRGISRRWTAAAGIGLLAAGCSAPELAEPEEVEDLAIEDDITAEAPSPIEQELRTTLDDFTAVVEAAHDALISARDATSATERAGHIADAHAHLLEDPDTAAPAVFPAVNPERDVSAQSDNLVTRTLSLARETSSSFGRNVVETLRDPISGDLGSWELDPEGMVSDLEATVADVTAMDDAAEAIMQLEGEGTRALAWTTLADSTSDDALAAEAAGRAVAHLNVVEVAISMLTETGEAEEDEPGAEGEPEEGGEPDGAADTGEAEQSGQVDADTDDGGGDEDGDGEVAGDTQETR